jgi:nucleoside-diphosphate-sugar epimerase
MSSADAAPDDAPLAEVVLITGFPAFTARRLVRRVLERDAASRIFLLTPADALDAARAMVAALGPVRGRVAILEGDVCGMDLALSGRELATLAAELTAIHHLAGHPGPDREIARRINVDGTRGVLELARHARRLRRVVHWSSAMVAGRRRGVVLEDELDEGQTFHDAFEATRFEAEVLARAAMRALPITVVRPSLVVGDSATGEAAEDDDPIAALVSAGARGASSSRGGDPLHLVPVDFVVEAACRLADDDRASGRTFHLTDPNPFSARKVHELVAALVDGRGGRGLVPRGLARTLDRLVRAPRALEAPERGCLYNCRGTLELLAGTGVVCPSFDRYVEALVGFARSHRGRASTEADPVDALDH